MASSSDARKTALPSYPHYKPSQQPIASAVQLQRGELSADFVYGLRCCHYKSDINHKVFKPQTVSNDVKLLLFTSHLNLYRPTFSISNKDSGGAQLYFVFDKPLKEIFKVTHGHNGTSTILVRVAND